MPADLQHEMIAELARDYGTSENRSDGQNYDHRARGSAQQSHRQNQERHLNHWILPLPSQVAPLQIGGSSYSQRMSLTSARLHHQPRRATPIDTSNYDFGAPISSEEYEA